jgi:hypothetical protein
MTGLRRLLVIVALMFWQGGFTFYSAAVVPVGRAVLATPFDQSLVTRHVTVYLNCAGIVTLALLAWDLVLTAATRRCRLVLWLAWLVMAAGLACLFWLHPQLDQVFDASAQTTARPPHFNSYHRAYLWVSTVQWFAGLVYLALLLRSWQYVDRTGIVKVED